MQEIIQLVVQKTGISEDLADKAGNIAKGLGGLLNKDG